MILLNRTTPSASTPWPGALLRRSLHDLPASALQTHDTLLTVYAWMRLSRLADERLLEVFRQGRVKGTVTGGQGNEGLCVPLALLLDKATDVISFTHRDLGGHLVWSGHLRDHLCQYLANSGSPTLGREGNIHHGDPAARSLPMISHLGAMLPNVLGSTDAQRRAGVPAVGVAQFGDGGSSTGDIHEAMNWAAVLDLPILFIIQNNEYAYSTPTREQFAVGQLAARAAAYGFEGEIVDCSDTLAALGSFRRALDRVRSTGKPHLIEARTLRLRGHAAYDTGDYLPAGLTESWLARDPLSRAAASLDAAGLAARRQAVDAEVSSFFESTLAEAIALPALQSERLEESLFAPTAPRAWTPQLPPPAAPGTQLTMAQALNAAHRKILQERPEALVMGQDIADYGGPFKVTDGLLGEFGRPRVLNAPLAESCMIGYATGLALGGRLPIVEFQFADFCSEAFTQLTLNAATYRFRSGASVPLVVRLPCGGGLTFGSFHSQELEAVLLGMPGLKALYPSTPQDAFNALLAAVDDPNPVLLFEHKRLYRGVRGPVVFEADYASVWRPRLVRSGTRATVVSYGDMLHATAEALAYLESEYGWTCDLWDLRALAPLQLDEIQASLARTHRLAVVHEGRRTHGFGAELVSRLVENRFFDLEAPPLRIASADTPVPFAPELEAVYRPCRDSIVEKLLTWLE